MREDTVLVVLSGLLILTCIFWKKISSTLFMAFLYRDYGEVVVDSARLAILKACENNNWFEILDDGDSVARRRVIYLIAKKYLPKELPGILGVFETSDRINEHLAALTVWHHTTKDTDKQ